MYVIEQATTDRDKDRDKNEDRDKDKNYNIDKDKDIITKFTPVLCVNLVRLLQLSGKSHFIHILFPL